MAANLASGGGGRCAHAPPWSVPSSWFHCWGAKKQFHIYFGNLKSERSPLTYCYITSEKRSVPEYLFVCRFHLHNRPPMCVVAPPPPHAHGTVPSVSLRSCTDGVTSSPLEWTNVYAAVAHSCRSVQPTLSFDFQPQGTRYTAGA